MEQNKLDYLKELMDKYELRQNTQNGELRAYLKGQNRAVNLSSAKMTDLAFAYAWARAWVEAGCYEYDKPVSERAIPGFDLEGKKVYDEFFAVMKNWAKGKEFHYYIDHFRMSNKVQKESQNPYAGRIVFQLFRPDRLDTKSEFHEPPTFKSSISMQYKESIALLIIYSSPKFFIADSLHNL